MTGKIKGPGSGRPIHGMGDVTRKAKGAVREKDRQVTDWFIAAAHITFVAAQLLPLALPLFALAPHLLAKMGQRFAAVTRPPGKKIDRGEKT